MNCEMTTICQITYVYTTPILHSSLHSDVPPWVWCSREMVVKVNKVRRAPLSLKNKSINEPGSSTGWHGPSAPYVCPSPGENSPQQMHYLLLFEPHLPKATGSRRCWTLLNRFENKIMYLRPWEQITGEGSQTSSETYTCLVFFPTLFFRIKIHKLDPRIWKPPWTNTKHTFWLQNKHLKHMIYYTALKITVIFGEN